MTEKRVLVHTKEFEILWQDMDSYGHVNNAMYFTYMQECRFDWLKAVDIIVKPTTKGPVLGSTSCKFISPIVYPANIIVNLYFAGRDGKKIFFEHSIYSKNNPENIHAIGEAVIIWYDFITHQSIYEPEEYGHLLPSLE